MITVFVEDCKLSQENLSQELYESIIGRLQLQQLPCPCCKHSACMSVHGYYYRTVKALPDPFRLRVMRVRCSECGSTHAILLDSIVPFSQILAEDQYRVVISLLEEKNPCSICDRNPSVDENNIKSVVRVFRCRWWQMILSLRIPLDHLSAIIRRCFSEYSLQFMQNHRGRNILFSFTT